MSEQDVLDAERVYSADALVDISLEMKDVQLGYDNVPYAFIGSPIVMSKQAVEGRLLEGGIHPSEISRVLDLLTWFGVLGVFLSDDAGTILIPV